MHFSTLKIKKNHILLWIGYERGKSNKAGTATYKYLSLNSS